MTAIAGVYGDSSEVREKVTRQLIKEQRGYCSSLVSIVGRKEATFGISPFSGLTSATEVVANTHSMVVADIRLDNRDELAERLGTNRHDLSDAATLLALWDIAGESGLSWIAGDFALALYDMRDNSLRLARDVTGQRPLFYARTGQNVAFTSMPAALRVLLGRLGIDRASFAAAACHVPMDTEGSLFEGIERVRPGEIVQFNQAGTRRHIYWQPQLASMDPGNRAELVEEYRHLLDLAVDARLKNCARPVATQLSSGYDSSAVTATAARLLQSRDQLVAFTAAPAQTVTVTKSLRRNPDEYQVAHNTAANLGIRHVVVRDSPPLADVLRRQGRLAQGIISDLPNMAWWSQIRAEAAATGANCILTGELGNYTLNAGGLYTLAHWVRLGRWRTWWLQARAAAGRSDTRWRGVLVNSFGPWMPRWAWDGLQRAFLGVRPLGRVHFVRPEWLAPILASAQTDGRPSADEYSARVGMILGSDFGTLRKGALADRGVDERDPLADRRLIEFSLKLPPNQLYWDGVPRPLAREALADRVPETVIKLPMRGLQGADWALRFTRSDAHSMLEEISASSVAREVLDLERLSAAIDHWPTDDPNRSEVFQEYRIALLGALASGMFALEFEGR